MRQFYPGPSEGARWHPEDIIGFPMTTGDYFFVDAAKTASGAGKSWDDAFDDLDDALLAVGSGDVIYMAPGTYTGNYTTNDDTGARNVQIIGVSPGVPGIRGGVNIVHSEDDEPVINIKASGWRVSNICLRPGLTSSGIQVTADQSTTNYINGVAGSISQGVIVENCMFWGGRTGKYGIVYQGSTGVNAPHYSKVINCHFDYMWATGGAAIFNAASSNPIRGALIYGNTFANNRSHINTYTQMGWVGSRFEKNTFTLYGSDTTAHDGLLDIRATATPTLTGGNAIVDNFFGCTKSEYADDASTGWVRTNTYDFGIGNWCSDGIPTADISH